MKDSRRCHRLRIIVPLSFKLSQLEERIETETSNLSATGFAFLSKERLTIGKLILFRLQLDDFKCTEIEGEIARVRQKWNGKFKEYLIGVKIVDQSDQEKVEYLKFIAEKMLNFFGS